MKTTATQLLDQIEQMGICVEYSSALGRLHAVWDHTRRTIYLNAGLPENAILPNLLHELEHVKAGHTKPQPRYIEQQINRRVARELITEGEYARAERLVGCQACGIAQELDLPRWVVDAYQQTLEYRLGHR